MEGKERDNDGPLDKHEFTNNTNSTKTCVCLLSTNLQMRSDDTCSCLHTTMASLGEPTTNTQNTFPVIFTSHLLLLKYNIFAPELLQSHGLRATLTAPDHVCFTYLLSCSCCSTLPSANSEVFRLGWASCMTDFCLDESHPDAAEVSAAQEGSLRPEASTSTCHLLTINSAGARGSCGSPARPTPVRAWQRETCNPFRSASTPPLVSLN